MWHALYFFGVLWVAYVLTVRPINNDSHACMLHTHTHLLCTSAARQVWWGNDFLSAKYSHTPHAHSSSSVIWFYIRPRENTLKPLPTPKFSLWVLKTFEKLPFAFVLECNVPVEAACVGCVGRHSDTHPQRILLLSAWIPEFPAVVWGFARTILVSGEVIPTASWWYRKKVSVVGGGFKRCSEFHRLFRTLSLKHQTVTACV